MFFKSTAIYIQLFESTCLLMAVPAFARGRVFECDGRWTEAEEGSGSAGGGATLPPPHTRSNSQVSLTGHPPPCGGDGGASAG